MANVDWNSLKDDPKLKDKAVSKLSEKSEKTPRTPPQGKRNSGKRGPYNRRSNS